MKEEKIMEAMEILTANWKAEDGSFLYYLHEENNFHEAAFLELCSCIYSLSRRHPQDQTVSSKIVFVYGQVLKHLFYHFDPQDLSSISNLPSDYSEKLELLEQNVIQYFQGDI